jgi:hypothetical protein
MVDFQEVHYAQTPAAVELLACGVRDDSMQATVLGPYANHSLGRLACFFSALLPQMRQAPLAAWEAGRVSQFAERSGRCLRSRSSPFGAARSSG